MVLTSPTSTCGRRLWGDEDPKATACSNPTPHDPGPATCRFRAAEAPDRHQTTEAPQESQ